jgi:TonB family protein
MPQPEPYGTPPTWESESSGHVGDVVSSQNPRDVLEVAKTLAAHGGGDASFDLALDLVLNEVVEQARLQTRATGAAIALTRAGEMVCRATTGADAPDLGVRLETKSGLSGACLQTAKLQQCWDTETDARVDAEACRRLGVRSILILPLGEGPEPFGVLEVFSSRPNAFGDHDVNTLQVLAGRVVANKKEIEEAVAVHPTPDELPALTQVPENSTEQQKIWDFEAGAPMEQGPHRSTDFWTSVLGVMVILAAVLLGLLVGWRGAISRGLRGRPQPQASAAQRSQGNRATESAGAPDANAAAADETAPSRGGSANSGSANPDSAPVPKAAGGGNSDAPPSGGLVVTQNGKVIYRLSPSGQGSSGANAPTKGSTDTSATRLIHRVEPEYPPEARAQHIQGAVVLDVQIGGDGAVHNIAVVEGNSLLAEAAVQAVRQWTYRPFSVDGQSVEMQTRITIRFTLPPT